jgi:hypothetical protein
MMIYLIMNQDDNPFQTKKFTSAHRGILLSNLNDDEEFLEWINQSLFL